MDAYRFGEIAIIGHNPPKRAAIIIYQIHLVDRKHDIFDAKQIGKITMPLGLRQDTFTRIDQNNRKVGRARSASS